MARKRKAQAKKTIRARNITFVIHPIRVETLAQYGARINGDGVPRTYASDYPESKR